MQLKRQFIAFFLLSVISLALLPKDWLHAVHDHDDTEHVEFTGKGAVIGNEHHHCVLFTTESPAFTDDAPHFFLTQTILDFAHTHYLTCADNNKHSVLPTLRGPPAC